MIKTANNNSNTGRQQKKRVQLVDLTSFSIQQLMEKAIKAYQQNDISSEDKWNTMITKSGTKKDKISAAGLLILQNPQSCLKYFDLFIKWCFDKNHNFAICACEGLASVYSDHIFVDKSSLSDFTDSIQAHIRNNKKNCSVTNAELISFYLQSEIKQHYNEFIKALQLLLGSELNHIKKICIRILGNLAKHKELRRTVLALIINKLGDTDMDVVNRVSKCLKQQFYQDLLASEVLMEETQRFLFRPNLPQKAQFFVINFLNNINLKFLNEKSLNKIFEIFYHFFTKSVSSDQNSDDLGSRLFLNSLKGLNRVFAFMKGGSKQTKKNISQKIEDVYKIIHVTPNIKAKIQLLLFLFQSHAHLQGNISSNNRFYRVLYEFISKDQVMSTSLSEMFFDLILVCIKQDQNLNRTLAMIKRMLQLCFGANSNFIITTLLMLDKIIQQKEGLKITLQKSEKMLDDQMQNLEKYDINKRDPLYAGAQSTCVWQLRCFCSHYHPTVRKFAQSILSNTPIQYEGNNPLLQFNLTSFIEKMSLRKERKSEAWRIKVKRNLSKIRTSKYRTLLDKQLQSFNEDEQFIKKYLEIRKTVHKTERKAQSNDIQQYADQVIEKEMDRLNPREADEELSITPIQSGEEFDYQEQNSYDDQQDQENNQEMLEQNSEFEEGLENQEEDFDSEQFDQEQNLGEQKQFQDVFNEIEEDNDNQQMNSRKKKIGFGKKTKNIQKRTEKNKNNRKKNHQRNFKKKKNGFKK